MPIKVIVLGIAALLSLGLFGSLEGAEGKIKGVAFGDYYFVVAGTDKNENGFKFRRIYLTYDLKWNDRWSGRVRYEANDAGFGGEDKMRPFVKHGYLRYRSNGRTVYMGLFGTPTWNVSERIWGYRSIEKTIMDKRKIGSSADIGVGFKGKLDGAGRVKAQLMFGNGSGQRPEADNGKKVYSLLHLKPTDIVEATVYFDWEGKPGGKDRVTFAGMLGTSVENFRFGLEGFVRNNRKALSGDDCTDSRRIRLRRRQRETPGRCIRAPGLFRSKPEYGAGRGVHDYWRSRRRACREHPHHAQCGGDDKTVLGRRNRSDSPDDGVLQILVAHEPLHACSARSL